MSPLHTIHNTGTEPVFFYPCGHRRKPLILPPGCVYDTETKQVTLAECPNAWAIPGHWFTQGSTPKETVAPEGGYTPGEARTIPDCPPGYDAADHVEAAAPAFECGHGDLPTGNLFRDFGELDWKRFRAMTTELIRDGLEAADAAHLVLEIFRSFAVRPNAR